jgi:hypothetical protein
LTDQPVNNKGIQSDDRNKIGEENDGSGHKCQPNGMETARTIASHVMHELSLRDYPIARAPNGLNFRVAPPDLCAKAANVNIDGVRSNSISLIAPDLDRHHLPCHGRWCSAQEEFE